MFRGEGLAGLRGLREWLVPGGARFGQNGSILRVLRVLVVPVRGFVAGLMVGGPGGLAGGEGVCWAKSEVLEGCVSGEAYVAGGKGVRQNFFRVLGIPPMRGSFPPA